MTQDASDETVTFDIKKFMSSPMGLIALGAFFVIAVIVVEKTNLLNSSPSASGTTTRTEQAAAPKNDGFKGDKGQTVKSKGGKILIDESQVEDGDLHAFNFFSEKNNKSIYFFVVKASDGSYRVAANGCEVCHGSKLGFTQVGDKIRCENCQQIYTKDQIALVKGGCNPRPIDKNAQISGGNLTIDVSDIEQSADLF
jgi:hypothetical protein